MISTIPLSLYVHIPWCVRKCPYCDFNSHRAGSVIPEKMYVERLIEDLKKDQALIQDREITSIFIGGGTPSLFSADSIARFLEGIQQTIVFSKHVEITMEANPGTVEQKKFNGFYQAGVNRLSIGVQSFQNEKLKALGRIHDASEAKKSVLIAKEAGFSNINLDLMHGLPNQSQKDALFDLQTAIDLQPQHISWYQLTLEPDTVFAKHPPLLPQDETLWNIQLVGEKLLERHSYKQYEVSAYSKSNQRCQHNLNYWQFGDYLAVGAGAHGKITQDDKIIRYWKQRNPRDYLQATDFTAGKKNIDKKELPLEFMMNVLRLVDGVPSSLFTERTNLPVDTIKKALLLAKQQDFLIENNNLLKTTHYGRRFLNDCLALFG